MATEEEEEEEDRDFHQHLLFHNYHCESGLDTIELS